MNRMVWTVLAALLAPSMAAAQDSAYCNITSVRATQLSNGVQIVVRADGVLRWHNARPGGAQVVVYLANAKSTIGKSFIDVGKYPVSHIQLDVPQSATQGVGITLTASLYEPASTSIEQSNDMQSLIITVNSRRTVTKRPGAASSETTPPPAAGMTVTVDGGLATVYAEKAKLVALLAEVGHKAGLNIAVDDSVKDREVSMTLDALPVADVLKGIAGATGLALSDEGGVYMVTDGVPTDLATYHLSSTESFRMKYTRASAASGLLPTFLYSYLHVNEAQNAVVVTAPVQMLDKIRADFQKIDVPPSQIMIEALAVEVASTADAGPALNLFYTKGDLTLSSDSATGGITYSTIGAMPNDFQARLNSLVAQGKAKVRANPRIAAVNGQDADLFVGETKFIKVQYNSGGYTQDRIQGVDIGVKLGIQSWTGGNGEITCTLSPEVSNISELERETGLPVLSTRNARTTVRVKDGETIVIGGLNQRQEYKTKTRVPLLGGLPFIGNLFRSSKTNTVDSELMIFVTPHILTETGRLKDTAREDEIRKRFQ
jgi:type II secretory pathway component GspD/PulD (secretin)